jgi:hypothetical protein
MSWVAPREKIVHKPCPRCCVNCSENAEICHSCGYAFSKVKRVSQKLIGVASISSLLIGLLILVVNQSSQLLERIKPTTFVPLGVVSAQGTNRLITDNYTIGINSGSGVLLERIRFQGTDTATSSLGVGIIHGKSYKSSDIATVRLNPTAIHLSYKPAPLELVNMFLEQGIARERMPEFFKVRPTSSDNQIYKKHPWAAISGKIHIDYFEPSRNSAERLTKEYPAQLLLWVRKADNLRQWLEKSEHVSTDIDDFAKQYKKVFDVYGSDT